MAKSEIVKIRVRPLVKYKYDEIAAREERTTAEVMRMALDFYIQYLETLKTKRK